MEKNLEKSSSDLEDISETTLRDTLDSNLESNLESKSEEQEALHYKGLGGWLILPIIGLFQLVLFEPFTILRYIPSLMSKTLTYHTSPGSYYGYSPLLKPVILFEMTFCTVYWALALAILILLFMKKKIVPRLFIILYTSNVAFRVIDFMLMKIIENNAGIGARITYTTIIASAIPAALWIAYFIKSERVKNTFVN